MHIDDKISSAMLHSQIHNRRQTEARILRPITLSQLPHPFHDILKRIFSQSRALPLIVPHDALDLHVRHARPPRLHLRERRDRLRLAWLEDEPFCFNVVSVGCGGL